MMCRRFCATNLRASKLRFYDNTNNDRLKSAGVSPPPG